MDDERIKLRTWLCSVVFVDIVGYSTRPVEVQMTWKGRFNDYVARAIEDLAGSDRVILDTGDGAAICFLGDPEAAMFSTLRLLDSLAGAEPKETDPMRVRIGINLGSVKLVKDINGNLNAVGDGINVAQRVMSFAQQNQILVSRSFYEVVSCLSDAYSRLFHYSGVRKDKHVREHTVYDLRPPGAAAMSIVGTPPVSAAAAAEGVGEAVKWEPAVLERARAALAVYVGPMARVMVNRAATKARTLKQLYDLLMSDIPSEGDREKFRK